MKCRVKSSRQLDVIRKKKVNELSAVSITAMLTVCKDRLHFGYDKIRKAAEKICEAFDSINQDYVTFNDLKESLSDADGVNIPFDFDHKQNCNTVDDAENIAAYAQKAFACAVLCTVLCDKFHFGQKKAQQAVRQFCEIFDELKNDRSRLAELKSTYLTDYEIQIH